MCVCVRARVRCARCVRSYSWMARLAGREEGLRRAAGREPAQDTEKTRARGADGGVESRPPREGLSSGARGLGFKRWGCTGRAPRAGRRARLHCVAWVDTALAGGACPARGAPPWSISFAGRKREGSSPLPEGSCTDRLLCRKGAGRIVSFAGRKLGGHPAGHNQDGRARVSVSAGGMWLAGPRFPRTPPLIGTP